MSGSNTGIPSWKHSLIEVTIFSGWSIREFNTDPMYSSG